jgi:hypothetical protein
MLPFIMLHQSVSHMQVWYGDMITSNIREGSVYDIVAIRAPTLSLSARSPNCFINISLYDVLQQ